MDLDLAEMNWVDNGLTRSKSVKIMNFNGLTRKSPLNPLITR